MRTGAEAFVAYVEDKFPGVVSALEKARTVVLQTAPHFATDPVFLQLPDGHDGDEGAIQLMYHAAAFLLRCGILNVDQDTTETNFGGRTVKRHRSGRRCTDPCIHHFCRTEKHAFSLPQSMFFSFLPEEVEGVEAETTILKS